MVLMGMRTECRHYESRTYAHGETVRNEVLGSGQGGTPNQRFSLRKPPLTYVSASTPSGTQSTLVVRVDGVLWQEVPSLFGLGPDGLRIRLQVL